MTVEASKPITYYFDPITQTHSLDDDLKKAKVTLTTPHDMPAEKLTQIIRHLGNYISLYAIINKSVDTQNNYCDIYRKHPSCEQRNYRNCKQHLTPDEIADCKKLYDETTPSSEMRACKYDLHGMTIERGDLKFMQQVHQAIRTALHPS